MNGVAVVRENVFLKNDFNSILLLT